MFLATASITGLLSVGLIHHASAVSEKANLVGQTISKNGISPNQLYMQECKQVFSANECATNPIVGSGPYTSKLAKSVNGPN